MTTCRGNHSMEAIYSHGPQSEREVVRWCSRCGAIRIDLDYDGRTNMGQIKATRLPRTEKERQGIGDEEEGRK